MKCPLMYTISQILKELTTEMPAKRAFEPIKDFEVLASDWMYFFKEQKKIEMKIRTVATGTAESQKHFSQPKDFTAIQTEPS